MSKNKTVKSFPIDYPAPDVTSATSDDKEFVVIYRINVRANSPLEAAKYVEGVMGDCDYRPAFDVLCADGTHEHIDLETEEE